MATTTTDTEEHVVIPTDTLRRIAEHNAARARRVLAPTGYVDPSGRRYALVKPLNHRTDHYPPPILTTEAERRRELVAHHWPSD